MLVFVGLTIAELLASLDSTIFTTALPTIVGQLHGVDQQLWVLTAYLLTSTISLPIYGKIGDLIGRKAPFLAAIALFVVGSIISGFAGDMTWLVIGRAVQGLGGGGLMILSDTIVADVVPARQRGRYMGIIGAVMVLASIGGPLVGGWFTDGPGWRWGLWINIPLGIAALIAAAVFMHLPKLPARKLRMDWAGMGLLTIALACLVMVTTWGGATYGWGSVQIVSLIVMTVVAGVLFVRMERRATEPVMPLTLFKDRNFNLTTIAGLIMAVAMFSVDGYLPTYLQMVTGVTAIQSGLLLLPMLIALIAASVAAGELVTRTGRYKWPPIAGAAIVATSLLLLSTMTPATPVWMIGIYIGIMGVGLGASLQILVLVVQNAFPISMVGVATATNNYFRQIGASVGAAVVGSLFTARLIGLLADQPPTDIPGGATSLTPRLVRSMPGPVRDIVMGIYSRALAPLFLYLIPVVIVAVVLLFFVIEKPLATTTEGEIRAPSDDIVGGEADARAAATTAARENDTVRENDTGRSTPEPVRAPSAADVNN
jgi:EmrB/QacA subfamily drug resistance transporter